MGGGQQFGSLLRSSRLAKLSKPLQASPANRSIPTHQVIETTPASFHRRDWGLKAPIPSKHRSLYVNVSALDSMEGLAQYEAGSGFYRKLQRFRELGQPVQLWKDGPNKHSLFEPHRRQTSLASMTPKAREQLINKASQDREKFASFFKAKLESVGQTSPTFKDSKADKGKLAEEFYNLETISFNTQKNSTRTAIGLNYGLKGALHNTPNGFYTNKVVNGRQVSLPNNHAAAALGGFISNRIKNTSADKLVSTQQYYVNRVEADGNGTIKVNAIQYDSRPGSSVRFYEK